MGNGFNTLFLCLFSLATLEIISVGAGLVKMLGVEAELFVTIDDSGVLRATVSNFYNLY